MVYIIKNNQKVESTMEKTPMVILTHGYKLLISLKRPNIYKNTEESQNYTLKFCRKGKSRKSKRIIQICKTFQGHEMNHH